MPTTTPVYLNYIVSISPEILAKIFYLELLFEAKEFSPVVLFYLSWVNIFCSVEPMWLRKIHIQPEFNFQSERVMSYN
jgi:hypothetical protein